MVHWIETVCTTKSEFKICSLSSFNNPYWEATVRFPWSRCKKKTEFLILSCSWGNLTETHMTLKDKDVYMLQQKWKQSALGPWGKKKKNRQSETVKCQWVRESEEWFSLHNFIFMPLWRCYKFPLLWVIRIYNVLSIYYCASVGFFNARCCFNQILTRLHSAT